MSLAGKMHGRWKSCCILTDVELRRCLPRCCVRGMEKKTTLLLRRGEVPDSDIRVSRREFLSAAFSGASMIAIGCGPPVNGTDSGGYGRLTARPSKPTSETLLPGLKPLGLEPDRDGMLYVPSTHRAGDSLPLVVYLHGAGGSSVYAVTSLQSLAESLGFALLVPDSRDTTWDIIRLGVFGPDVSYIDRALRKIFSGLTIDPSHIVLAGFSDGASYALSLGITNGDLFTHLLAFSPCILSPAESHGSPAIFISHGTTDPILNIDRCGRRLATLLRSEGRTVVLEEFEGGHTVPPDVKTHALEWAGLTPRLPSSIRRRVSRDRIPRSRNS
jgi:phospholipase/carboxylesterase